MAKAEALAPLITFGSLCAAAWLVAACSYEDRRCLIMAASVLCVNWLLFSMPWIYNPLSVAHLLVLAGFEVSHLDTWSVMDLVSMTVVIVMCRHTWWAPVIWSPYLITLSMHAVAWANDLEYTQYKDVLDAALIVQLATLFVVGGGGCADRLLNCRRHFRRLGSGPGKLAKLFRSAP